MAKPIKGTPVLRGEGANEVLREMRITGSHDYSKLRDSLNKSVTVTRTVFREASASKTLGKSSIDVSRFAK
jgi:hypothetical protein